jgi:hypothetical protein
MRQGLGGHQMKVRTSRAVLALVGGLTLLSGAATVVEGQSAKAAPGQWKAARLADGQPDIQGMWNNEEANFTPLELPAELAGRTSFTAEELQALAEKRAKSQIDANEKLRDGDPGFYALYWFDWYWRKPQAGDWPALVVEPKNGKMPALTPAAQKKAAYMREHLHDTYSNIEAGDRCLTRGVLGMMLPTAYNNGTMILQSPGFVVIFKEMIHNARIIPVDGRPHLGQKLQQLDGDPRGRWEGNTLVVESTNFRAIDNLRGPNGRAMQTERRRIVERFELTDANTLKYSATVDDPETYTAPWTVSFPFKRDNEYKQFEYACHEGNYAVPNSLSGARAEEREAAAAPAQKSKP